MRAILNQAIAKDLIKVASANADTPLLAANQSRQIATIFNGSTAVLSLLFAATGASASNKALDVAAGGYYELPPGYVGPVCGFWASANGSAYITELE